MKKIIVTTTINAPTEATLRFSRMEGWDLIVVGDKKTPHEEYKKIDCYYFHPEDQESKYNKLSNLIGWNNIQRRNLGFVEAYNIGADIIATVDDDNIPYENWGQDLILGKEIACDLFSSENGVFDPLSATNTSEIWHRGYPLELLGTKNNITYKGKVKNKFMVQADLWDGDPDIDAITRLTVKPIVKYTNKEPFWSKQISPFNSQNTFLVRDAIRDYAVIPGVGRMDDIWGAYFFQKSHPESVVYNKASVYQDRNEQDLIVNLEKEIIGYKNNLNLINGDFDIPKHITDFYKTYQESFNL